MLGDHSVQERRHKYAGDGAAITVLVDTEQTRLRFAVSDDGARFAAGDIGAADGHGFLTMRDRLGAIGGVLDVRSTPGGGATLRGTVPATPVGGQM